MLSIISQEIIEGYLASIIRMSTPLVYAMLGALISKKAGTQNLAIEGTMLLSACTGAIASIFVPNLWFALAVAILSGVGLSLFLAFMFLKMKADGAMTCIALNTMMTGLTAFLPLVMLEEGSKGSTLGYTTLVFPTWEIPLLRDIPYVRSIVSGHSSLTYIAVLATVVVWYILFKTPLGKQIRAAGESPDAAASVGVNAYKTKLIAFVMTGVVCALGGVFMSMAYLSWFKSGMVSGRGFIGMCISDLTGGRPFFGYLVASIFGAIDSLSLTLQSIFSIPTELLQMIPYIATIVGVALVAHLDTKRKIKRQSLLSQKKQSIRRNESQAG